MRLADSFWRRRLHPAGAWLRVVFFYALAWALWRHAWPWVGGLLAALATSPWWFPPAKRVDSFPSRALLGERVWLDTTHGPAKACAAAGSLLLLGALAWALVARQPFPALALLGVVTVLRAGFLALVARLPAADPDATEETLGRILADAGSA